jgi:hypothetical protein
MACGTLHGGDVAATSPATGAPLTTYADVGFEE